MDNLKKRDYANFNNSRNNRGYLPNRNVDERRDGSRYGGNVCNSKSNDMNKFNNRNVPVQYSKGKNTGNKKSNVYDTISSTVQKKFNSVLYKGKIQNTDDKVKKANSNMIKNMDKKENNLVVIKEEEATVPKSVFIFITIAVIFATGLVVMLTQPGENTDKKVADNSEYVGRSSNYTDGDDGFETFAGEEEMTEDLEGLEEGVENLEVEVVDENVPQSSDSTSNATSNTTSKTTDKKTSSSSNSNANNSTTTTSIVEGDVVTSSNTPRATLKPEAEEEDEDKELANVTVDEGKFTLPSTVTGSLYKTSSSYTIVGYDGKLSKYTNFVKESIGTTVPRNDLDGIWVFSKSSVLSSSSVTSVYGYKNGVKQTICKVTIKKGSTNKYMYAIKNTKVDLSEGTYKYNGATITELTVDSDKTIVEY